jgi:hypothetical protein
MKGKVVCYRIDRVSDSAKVLHCKSLDCEPRIYSRLETGVKMETLSQRNYSLCTKSLEKLPDLLKVAKDNNLQSKLQQEQSIPAREHYLLEYQIGGKYYYDEGQGPYSPEAHAPSTAPIARYLNDLVQFCESITK